MPVPRVSVCQHQQSKQASKLEKGIMGLISIYTMCRWGSSLNGVIQISGIIINDTENLVNFSFTKQLKIGVN